ncbi:hypothetical protein [Tenacibaculum amylolyticum]|uniref:hypothetical protein n=1 Tax=Tenacibaculum amylolyticum TaxID=104269 RepID=UPI0038956C5C
MNIPDTVLFSTSISITTFFLGFIIRERILIYTKNNKLKSSNGFIKWQFKNLLESIPKQAKSYNELAYNIKTEDYRNWYIEPKLKPKIILEKEELIHTILFERKKGSFKLKDEIFNNIITHSNLVDLILKETNTMFNKLNQETLSYEIKLDSTGVRLYQKIMEINSKIERDLIEKKILSIYDKFGEIKIKKRSLVLQELSSKIENLIISENYSKIQDYLKFTSEYQKDFEYYSTTLQQFYNKTIEYQKSLEFSLKILSENINEYNNLNFKNSWRN